MDLLDETIWNNRFITMENKILYWDEWIQKGIIKIKHLLNNKGEFYSHSEIANKYNIKCNFLQALQIRQCIPHEWRKKLYQNVMVSTTDRELGIIKNEKYTAIRNFKCKEFYWCLVNAQTTSVNCKKKWAETFPKLTNVGEEIWHRIFLMPFTTTRETKLQSFQYKITHRIIACNKWLFDIKIKESKICNYCEEVDDLQHFFLHCNKIEQFWESFINWWNRINTITLEHDFEELDECILFGFPGKGDIVIVVNYCVLVAKFYIYMDRMNENNKIDFYQFLLQLKTNLVIKRSICKNNNSLKTFDKFIHILDSF